MEVKVDIKGGKDIQNALRQLPGRVAGKALRQALAFSGRPIRDEARQILRGAGYSRRTWMGPMIKTQRNPNPFTALVKVGYKSSAKHLYFLENGAAPHVIPNPERKPKGFKVGGEWHIWGEGEIDHKGIRKNFRPWLRPAFDSKKDDALRLFSSEIWERINNEAKRLRRR